MSDGDEDDRLTLFIRLLDTLQKLEEARRQSGADGDGRFGYGIVMGRSDGTPAGASWLVTDRRKDTGHLVVLDVPRIDTHAIEETVEDGTLTFRLSGETIKRVALPERRMTVVGRADRNGVLEVRLAVD